MKRYTFHIFDKASEVSTMGSLLKNLLWVIDVMRTVDVRLNFSVEIKSLTYIKNKYVHLIPSPCA